MRQTRKLNNLDNPEYIQKLDKSNMMAILLDFPAQLREALDAVGGQRLYPKEGLSNCVFAGVGGSAIGGEVARSCLLDEIKVPFIVNRDYFAPGFVNSKTLLFISSYSGNTEETISAYKDGRKKKAKIVVITSNGKLEALAKEDGYPIIKVPAGMPPRCALAYSFIPAIAVISKIGLVGDKQRDIREAANVTCSLRDALIGPNVSSKENEAKRIASVLTGRMCTVYGASKNLDCVITRWRNQFNENSKSFAASHFLPEMNHNEIMGFSHPKKLLKDMVVVFLRDKGDHARVNKRIEITRSIINRRVHRIIEVNSRGDGLIARICGLTYIGDFASFYLAILNGEDPTPVDEISYLKKELSKRGGA